MSEFVFLILFPLCLLTVVFGRAMFRGEIKDKS